MKTYYDPEDLKKFGQIGEFQKPMADKFFAYYGEVFAEGALTAREKSLIALAVSIIVAIAVYGAFAASGLSGKFRTLAISMRAGSPGRFL